MTGKQSYVWIVRPIYMIAPWKGLKGDAAQAAANQARNTYNYETGQMELIWYIFKRSLVCQVL